MHNDSIAVSPLYFPVPIADAVAWKPATGKAAGGTSPVVRADSGKIPTAMRGIAADGDCVATIRRPDGTAVPWPLAKNVREDVLFTEIVSVTAGATVVKVYF